MLAAAFATSAASGVASQWPVSRRGVLFAAVAAPLAPLRSSAAVDCLQDCQSNCFRVAPKSGRYCLDSCAEYCDQPDRRDGLSGSISNDAAEAPLPSDASPHLPPSPRHIVPFQKNQKEGCTTPLRWGAGASPPALPDALNLAPTLRRAIVGGGTPNGGPASVEAFGPAREKCSLQRHLTCVMRHRLRHTAHATWDQVYMGHQAPTEKELATDLRRQ
ncbi:hypothetical protein EMIHUDRAFT_221046 [Emiliania huxleyi CCMP1516]|uniref:Uncharacterized protein n=2 Tax=Emiliania huxleyi TaxID=2903 RepID=A0A0D3HZW6_EMIH1|nr:hypothetical protein EMIHUDRAFT_221046 [Emiliania huxleyi CCMP1516]EOD04551.1 hypothetical protein EMIHUDRAFT_221046 [Emiliania huxleyi CCMP1516]|eukprot:XP_005756980.1 hypothetical protein EMIHUDRAFT_221046 [Emiliania huxleyi CCMP1516]